MVWTGAHMSSPEEIVRNWYAAANRFDIDAVSAAVSVNMRCTFQDFDIDSQGKADFLDVTRSIWNTFEDRQLLIKSLTASKSSVAVEMEIVGTSPGGRDNLPPKGTPLRMNVRSVLTVEDGLITEERLYLNH